jgi:hypothetical protein
MLGAGRSAVEAAVSPVEGVAAGVLPVLGAAAAGAGAPGVPLAAAVVFVGTATAADADG